jgi:hypothetical protein
MCQLGEECGSKVLGTELWGHVSELFLTGAVMEALLKVMHHEGAPHLQDNSPRICNRRWRVVEVAIWMPALPFSSAAPISTLLNSIL